MYTKRPSLQLKYYITAATNSFWVGFSDRNLKDWVKLKEQIPFHLKTKIIIKLAKQTVRSSEVRLHSEEGMKVNSCKQLLTVTFLKPQRVYTLSVEHSVTNAKSMLFKKYNHLLSGLVWRPSVLLLIKYLLPTWALYPSGEGHSFPESHSALYPPLWLVMSHMPYVLL